MYQRKHCVKNIKDAEKRFNCQRNFQYTTANNNEVFKIFSNKTLKLFQGPFDVCRQVFIGNEETRKMTIDDKVDLFFHDYQLSPLFVQENYPYVHPYAGR